MRVRLVSTPSVNFALRERVKYPLPEFSEDAVHIFPEYLQAPQKLVQGAHLGVKVRTFALKKFVGELQWKAGPTDFFKDKRIELLEAKSNRLRVFNHVNQENVLLGINPIFPPARRRRNQAN